MPLNLTGPEGLFTRIGHLIYGVDTIVNQYRGDSLSQRTDLIQQDYVNTDPNLIDSLYSNLTSTQTSHTAMINYWRSLAQNTVTQMVNEFRPQLNNTYSNALGFLFNYLVSNNETVFRNSLDSAVTPVAGNRGNGTILVSVVNALGYHQEYMFHEGVTARVTRDAQSGTAVGQEVLQFSGTYGVTDMMHWLWPQGSNALVSLTAITPNTSGGSATKNWLTNGMMETFTSNVPNGWHVKTGTFGTTYAQDLVSFYDGVSSLQFIGDGAEHTTVWTQFGVDFSGTLQPGDLFACHLWYKLGTATPATGTLTLSLTDGTGAVLSDTQGSPSSVSVDLTGKDTQWHTLGGYLRTPSPLPSAVYLMISLSNPLPAGVKLNLDRIALARPVSFYPGGPLLACFSGNANWTVGDSYAVATINQYDGLMQSGCNKLLNLNDYGLILPSTTGTPTIPDTLVS